MSICQGTDTKYNISLPLLVDLRFGRLCSHGGNTLTVIRYKKEPLERQPGEGSGMVQNILPYVNNFAVKM